MTSENDLDVREFYKSGTQVWATEEARPDLFSSDGTFLQQKWVLGPKTASNRRHDPNI